MPSGRPKGVKNKKYTYDFKLQVVTDYVINHLSMREVMKKYSISSGTFSVWYRNYQDGILETGKERKGNILAALHVSQYYKKLNVSFLDSDKRHPTTVCYFIAAVSLYCYLVKKKPNVSTTYKSIGYSKKSIIDVIGKDYGFKTVSPTSIPKPTLSIGSSGNEVKKLQRVLNKHGASLKVDGKFGYKTQTAYKMWQLKYRKYANPYLKVDGVHGVKSYNVMKEYC